MENLDAEDMPVATLITDRHRQIAKWVREECPETTHLYDIWHIAKGKSGITSILLK